VAAHLRDEVTPPLREYRASRVIEVVPETVASVLTPE
jgi:hypothetical protein